MCTSFAVYSRKPVYGMNFDFPDVELKFEIQPAEGGDVLYMCFFWDGQYRKVAGVNSAGLFAAAQILVAQFEIELQPGEVTITPYELFTNALETGRQIDDVINILGDRRLAYNTLRKGHQLYAGMNGKTCVVEPGPKSNRIYTFSGCNTVLTNNLFERQQVRAMAAMQRLGVDRFQIAQQVIDARRANFTIADGFELLRRTQMVRGRFTTQCSIVVDPAESSVYLSLKRDFQQLWRFDLSKRSVQTFQDRDEPSRHSIPAGGITSADLALFRELV
jgi:hypothetical protein